MVTLAYAAPSPPSTGPWLSLVIPLFNEAESLGELHHLINESLGDGEYEVIFVDDGSTDDSFPVLRQVQQMDARVRIIRFARNFGKAEALAAGFRESRGQVVITMDADLQDDPREIPKLVNALDRGFDLATGWKRERRDPPSKTLPSRLFNAFTSLTTGLALHDLNSGFKAYRRRVVADLNVYGELHRFLPVLAYWKGFRVTEVPVVHHPRRYGKSKYGARRFLSGALDLMTVLYLTRFQRKPLHLFGPIGLACLAAGLAVNVYLTGLWFTHEPIGTRPLLQLGVLLMVMGVQFLSLGLLGEMVTLNAVQDKHRAHVYEVLDPWPQPLPPAPDEAMPSRPGQASIR
ncbi:MAG: glycosyltransferase [Dehalococcoidia bacterium]|nr:glycosyltransferase [Dehalococcoidia bacterium]